jgi:hypothetical protein
MFAPRATQKDTQKQMPSRTKQASQSWTPGIEQTEDMPDFTPFLQRYLGNSYVQSMTKGGASQQEVAVPPIVQEVLHSPGQPLDPATRGLMESHFGYDFSQVRVHTDVRAAASVGAKALTSGVHILFGRGRGPNDKKLLVHELAHVVQQARGRTIGLTGLNGDEHVRSVLEREALDAGNLGVQYSANSEANRKASLSSPKNPRSSTSRMVIQLEDISGPLGTELKARKDPTDSRRIIFNRPVTLEEAIIYLWEDRYIPSLQDIVPDPAEKVAGRQTRFLLDTTNISAMLNMRTEVLNQYKPDVTTLSAPPQPFPTEEEVEQSIPNWVPGPVRGNILRHALEIRSNFLNDPNYQFALPQVKRFPVERPWGDIVLWVGENPEFPGWVVVLYQYYPQDRSFYEETYGRGGFFDLYSRNTLQARLAYRHARIWNKDMEDYVEKQGLHPKVANARFKEQWYSLSTQWIAAVGEFFASAGGFTPRPGPRTSFGGGGRRRPLRRHPPSRQLPPAHAPPPRIPP